jgi:signal transduction histidine kinase
MHPEHVTFLREQDRRRKEGFNDMVDDYQLCVYTKEGKEKWIYYFTKNINYEGKSANLVCLIDITERKKMENELVKSEDKYRKAYNRAEFYKDLFAHDINNILQNISMGVELNLLKFKELGDIGDLGEINEMIIEQVNRGAKLVSNIQTISQVEQEQLPLKPTEVMSILQDSISFIQNSFQQKNPEILLESEFKEIVVNANEFIQEVFDNILINAIQHGNKSQVQVLIKISKEETNNSTFYKMQFIDNGTGIPDDMKEDIFLRSYNKSKSTGGMGLGLSLVKKIVESYHGRIWVENKVKGDSSKGSNFVILIPEHVQEQI